MGFRSLFSALPPTTIPSNPSRFAPRQLIIAHAALSDPAAGKLLHDQKSAREGFGLAYAKEGDTDVKLDDWNMLREEDGRYQTSITADNFVLRFSLTPIQRPCCKGITAFHARDRDPSRQATTTASRTCEWREPFFIMARKKL